MSQRPISFRTLGPRQKSILTRACMTSQGPMRVGPAREREAALRLHEKGLLIRGKTSREYYATDTAVRIFKDGKDQQIG